MGKEIKVCLTCSAGGHLHQLQVATENIIGKHYWVLYSTKHTKKFAEGKDCYFIKNFEPAKKYTLIINFIQSFFLLLKKRPDVIISSGAGVSVPTIFLGKKIFGCKIIYLCSAANVTEPSRTPLWAHKYSDLFLTQWEETTQLFPGSINIGVL